MNTSERAKLADVITRQVMDFLSDKYGAKEAPGGGDRILVLGEGGCPLDGAGLFRLEDYEQSGDIKKYESVFMSSLTLWQLSDIAQCRDSSPFCCAVLKALAGGVPVYIERKTLDALRCEEINPAMDKTISGNISALLSYGVRIRGVEKEAPTPRRQPAGTKRGLITELEARRMCGNSEKKITLAKGTVVTPLAKDYFNDNGISVEYEKQGE